MQTLEKDLVIKAIKYFREHLSTWFKSGLTLYDSPKAVLKVPNTGLKVTFKIERKTLGEYGTHGFFDPTGEVLIVTALVLNDMRFGAFESKLTSQHITAFKHIKRELPTLLLDIKTNLEKHTQQMKRAALEFGAM